MGGSNMRGLELGIEGRTALVCGASKGLGRACAEALARAGVELVICARSLASLEETARQIEVDAKVVVRAVVADVTTEKGRDAVLKACPAPDILVNNAAGPKPGRFEDWSEADWRAALSANMIAPILLIKSVIGQMRRRRWGRIINITSSAVKAPLPLLGLSNGARSGLTGFVSGIAREVARDGVTINNLLPGHFDTDRLKGYTASLATARSQSPEDVLQSIANANPTGRIGRPEEFGATCVFLASEHAGYITGQNILLDGGAYPGVL
jgi:3-oxoacyl-[acyl-carrier protein] reductase